MCVVGGKGSSCIRDSLHGGRSDDGVRNFFNDVYELFVKVMGSCVQGMEGRIESKAFDDRVRAVARRYLS